MKTEVDILVQLIESVMVTQMWMNYITHHGKLSPLAMEKPAWNLTFTVTVPGVYLSEIYIF